MTKNPDPQEPHNPFGKLVGWQFTHSADGISRCQLEVTPQLLNPHGVLHGGVVYSLADTGMGAALYSLLEPGISCATAEIKISYFRPVTNGMLECETRVLKMGRKLAFLESEVRLGEDIVAKASGTYAIIPAPNTARSA